MIGLTESGVFGDDPVSAYVVLAMAIPFFVIYARDRKRWWALIPGGVLAVIGLSFGSRLSWQSVRSSPVAGGAAEYAAALALLVVGVWMRIRAFVGRDRSGEAALPGSDEPAPSGPEVGEPPAV